jgi:hypothetical protein
LLLPQMQSALPYDLLVRMATSKLVSERQRCALFCGLALNP